MTGSDRTAGERMENQYDEMDGYSGSEHNTADENKERLNRRREFRKHVRRLCSYLGFSLCVLFVVVQFVSIGISRFKQYLGSNMVMGLGAEVYKLMNSDWFSLAGYNLLAYSVAVPAMMLVMRRVPEMRIEPKKMRISKLLMFFVLCMGSGYIFNMVGNIINLFLALMTGRSIYSMTPISDMMLDMSLITALYIGVLGPIIEEYIFRGLLLNRMRPLGERAAIIFSALMFGVLHGNLSQFLYASSIGLVLGYVASKTGRIFYSSILHIMVNSYSVFLSFGLSYSMVIQGVISLVFSLIILGVALAAAVGSIVIFFTKRRKTRLERGGLPDGVEFGDFSWCMFLNPGVIVFSLICFYLILFYAFFS